MNGQNQIVCSDVAVRVRVGVFFYDVVAHLVQLRVDQVQNQSFYYSHHHLVDHLKQVYGKAFLIVFPI